MAEHCPEDGGFIGKAGCTHPHHQHSELVNGLLKIDKPALMKVEDADAALDEGFYIQSSGGKRVGFGKNLKSHIEHDESHGPLDIKARKERLQFAIKAVTNPDRVEKNHRGIEGRTAYAKSFKDFGVLVVSEPESDDIENVFTFFPRRSMKKRP